MVKGNLLKKNNTQFQKRAEHWKFSLNSFRNQTAKHSSSTFFFLFYKTREKTTSKGERELIAIHVNRRLSGDDRKRN